MAEVGEEGGSVSMPVPETDELGRYLEDTITIDWQTPAIMHRAKGLLSDCESPADRVRALFDFVRDAIDHSIDVPAETATCRASEVLSEGTGLCYAKSHLLSAFLRYAGFPAGFCYARLTSGNGDGRYTLHGFNAVWWVEAGDWIFLDARGDKEGVGSECRFEAPWSLAYAPDVNLGESLLPFIYKRPAKRIIDLLERAPDFAAVLRNLPDTI
jgi:transglutaminase-like putative cysteine protease